MTDQVKPVETEIPVHDDGAQPDGAKSVERDGDLIEHEEYRHRKDSRSPRRRRSSRSKSRERRRRYEGCAGFTVLFTLTIIHVVVVESRLGAMAGCVH